MAVNAGSSSGFGHLPPPHDQAWLDYQEEIGLRHTRAKKNRTDNAQTPPHIPLRYLLAFTATMNATDAALSSPRR